MCLLRERVCLLVSVLSTTSNNRLLYDASSPLVTIQANVLSLSKRGQRFHRCAYTRMYWFRFSSMASLLFFSFGVTRVVAVGDIVVCVCFVFFLMKGRCVYSSSITNQATRVPAGSHVSTYSPTVTLLRRRHTLLLITLGRCSLFCTSSRCAGICRQFVLFCFSFKNEVAVQV